MSEENAQLKLNATKWKRRITSDIRAPFVNAIYISREEEMHVEGSTNLNLKYLRYLSTWGKHF